MNRAKLKGFTLIELLVVISIIALLLSILMPSLSKVKDQAKSVVCSANLRQISIGLQMYTDAYNGKIPVVYDSIKGDFVPAWYVLIGEVMGWKETGSSQNQVLTRENVTHCPAVSRIDAGDYWFTTHYGTSNENRNLKLNQLKSPMERVFLSDAWPSYYHFNARLDPVLNNTEPGTMGPRGKVWPFPLITTRHDGSMETLEGDANELFFDLHVEKLSLKELHERGLEPYGI
jgi:prepilin-type N-terminal cleavage/methylation domain-containing protein